MKDKDSKKTQPEWLTLRAGPCAEMH